MSNGRILRNSQIIILGVCIAAATIVSSIIFSKGFMKVMRFSREVITVTGSAQKEITSDYAVWYGEFSRRDADLATAYRALKDDLEKVRTHLVSKGMKEADITVSQALTQTFYQKNEKGNDTNEIEGYCLKMSVGVQSNDVYGLEKLSRESTELIDQGIHFESHPPEYFYTKLEELKIEMLANATENAKMRAEKMAQATGNRIGSIRSAKMGVFQITPVHSTEVSDWGVNDTSSLIKKMSAVVTVSIAIE